MNNADISVLLICQNSEHSITRTLNSLKKFKEVVVVDGGSTDKTAEIAKSYPNVKYVLNPWPGFIEQRNFSIAQATYDWCFMIDSDEACTEELADEMHRIVQLSKTKVLYRVMRTEYFLGGPIEHGFGKSAYQERLFQKARVKYGGGVHHWHLIDNEHVGPEHPDVENLDSKFRILHDENYNLDDWLAKLSRYSTIVAKEKISKNKKVNLFTVLVSFPGTFIQIYWKSRKEGKRGIIIALCEALYRTTVKLYIYKNQFFPKS